MAAEVLLVESLKVAPPKALFQTCATIQLFPDYTVMPDGSRFLLACESQATRNRSITVAMGWRSMAKGPGRKGPEP